MGRTDRFSLNVLYSRSHRDSCLLTTVTRLSNKATLFQKRAPVDAWTPPGGWAAPMGYLRKWVLSHSSQVPIGRVLRELLSREKAGMASTDVLGLTRSTDF